MRAVIAFLVAPLAAMLPAVAFPMDWMGFLLITLSYAYPLTLFVGLPSYFYFRRKGWLRFWQAGGAGAIIGCLPPILFALWVGLTALVDTEVSRVDIPSPIPVLLVWLLFGASLGAGIALVFWVVAIATKPSASRGNTTQDMVVVGK